MNEVNKTDFINLQFTDIPVPFKYVCDDLLTLYLTLCGAFEYFMPYVTDEVCGLPHLVGSESSEVNVYISCFLILFPVIRMVPCNKHSKNTLKLLLMGMERWFNH